MPIAQISAEEQAYISQLLSADVSFYHDLNIKLTNDAWGLRSQGQLLSEGTVAL
jgi:hypothetical protein